MLALGSAYVPLRSSVLAARDRRKDRAGGLGDRPRVLVVMGGTDAGGALVGAVEALVNADVSADVLAVSPQPGPGLKAEAMSTRHVRVLATPVRSDLPRLLAGHDLVLSASGTTVWELCCIGTPMAVVHVTDNQRPVHDAVVAAGAALGLGGVADLPQAAGKLRALLRDGFRRLDLAAAGQGLVDGGGAGRVVDLMEAVVAGAEQPWQLRARAATDGDAERLLAWRNDPVTRAASVEPGEVTAEAHRAWLAESLASRDRLLLVVEAAATPVATVRWDRLESRLAGGRRGLGGLDHGRRPSSAAPAWPGRCSPEATVLLGPGTVWTSGCWPGCTRTTEPLGGCSSRPASPGPSAPPDERGFLTYVKA